LIGPLSNWRVLACLPALLLAGCSEPSQESIQLAELEAVEEIEAMLELQGDDWSRGDLESFTGIYSENCIYISPSGLVEGRQALLESYRSRYPGREAMGTLKLDIIEMRPAFVTVRSLIPELKSSDIGGVSVVARWTLSYPEREATTGLTLLVFRRIEGEWKIVHDASM
jgi:hypothetical protein